MLENFFKGDIPSIFETTIKRERGRTAADSSKTKSYRNEEEFLRSVKATICYCGAFWTFGMAAAVIGPTILELGCVTNRPVNITSWVFFSQAVSALFGSSLGGFLADRYDCNIILLYCVTSVAIYLAIIPVCHVFGVMLAFFALLGVHMGVIDTVANSMLIKIHGKKVAPRLQSLHFFYGLGALISPVIAEPFLRSACADGHFQSNIFGWSLENTTLERMMETDFDNFIGSVTLFNDSDTKRDLSSHHYRTRTFVQYAYWLVALLQVPVQSGLFYLIYHQRYLRRWAPDMFSGRVVTLAALPPGDVNAPEEEVFGSLAPNYGPNLLSKTGCQGATVQFWGLDENYSQTVFLLKSMPKTFSPDLPHVFNSAADHSSLRPSFCSLPAKVPLVTTLAALLLFLFDGLQGAYGGYLYTYAVKGELHLPPGHGAYLTSIFWCLFAVGRFVSIFVSVFLMPDKMLLINLFGSFLAISVVLYLHQFSLALWIGSAMFGLFMSSVFPSTLSMAECYIDVTGSIASILIVSSATGEMVFPLLVGKVFASEGPLSFLVITFTVCTFALLVFMTLRMVARTQISQSVNEVYSSAMDHLCRCVSTEHDCEYSPLILCDEEAEQAQTKEPMRAEPAHELQS